jgi:hypothetical protein
VRLLSQALENMADATMEKDVTGLEDATLDAHEALNKLIED